MTTHGNFVHLHTHTEYSFLDGAIRIKDLVKKATGLGMPALAITDHGGMFGAIEFYNTCMKAGIKPIIGFEAYVAPTSRFDKTRSSSEDNYNHLILLARNNDGYKNLMQLSTIGYLEGFYYKPRIDMEVLRKFGSNLIATSACVAGAIPRALLDGRREKAKEIAAQYVAIFGEGNFFFELQDHGIKDEQAVMPELISLGNEMGIPFTVANDAHYLNKEDSSSHEILLCIQTQTTISDPDRFRFGSDQIYFKTAAEMAQLFPTVKGAMENTLAIAERCNVNPIEPNKVIARPGCPPGYDSEAAYLAHLARKGLKEKLPHATPGIEERLEYELSVITKMGFDGYFLAVRDFVTAAKEMGIMTGCRGSAAGSLAAYVIGITDVDPIRFDLIFERFLNPERVSMPDADIDFADRDRARVIDYVVKKYGQENVCQIINFGRMKSKLVVKDVARVMGLPVAEAAMLSSMIEDTLENSLKNNGELQAVIKKNPVYADLFRHAQVLEGLARQAGMHAAGVVIAPKPVVNWAPLYKQPGEDTAIMTQYDMKYVEDAGLIKMDFLGLITLTILQDTIAYVKRIHGVDIDLWKLPDRDARTYELFGRGETVAVFQFESQGMQDNLRKLKPDNIEDLIAMNALYRPGPIGEIPTYIHRKHGKEKVEYPHPLVADILQTTHGVIVYQEQVMRIAQVMGGFTMGQADGLRKAMGKKNMAEMEKMKVKFMAGAKERGVEAKIADDIYTKMQKFGEYAFNKAHATVYAHVAYQCAYLKAHYPIEFMTANLSSVLGKSDDILIIKSEAERMGIKILPPDVNTSDFGCSIEDGKIRLGLGTIKNVGKAAEEVIRARGADGPFRSIFDLCKRVDLRQVNKKCLESIACAGALDSCTGTRSQFFAAIDRAIEYGSGFQRERLSGQTNLFAVAPGAAASGEPSIPEPQLPGVPPWPYNEMLTKEKEVLNFYVSGHPLERFRDEITGFASFTLSVDHLDKLKPDQVVTVGGMITTVRVITSKNGKLMAFCGIEDFDGSTELIVFSEAYEKFKDLLTADTMVLVHGKVSIRGDDERNNKPKIIIDNAIALSESREKLTRSVHLRLRTQGIEPDFLTDISTTCLGAAGNFPLILHLVTQENNEFRIRARRCKVNPEPATIACLREKAGKENVWISKLAA